MQGRNKQVPIRHVLTLKYCFWLKDFRTLIPAQTLCFSLTAATNFPRLQSRFTGCHIAFSARQLQALSLEESGCFDASSDSHRGRVDIL